MSEKDLCLRQIPSKVEATFTGISTIAARLNRDFFYLPNASAVAANVPNFNSGATSSTIVAGLNKFERVRI